MKQILVAIKDVFLSYYPTRSFIESLVKFDFRIGDQRTNLMQLCFSNLASWPLVLILAVLYWDPFKSSWSLMSLVSFEHPLIHFFTNGSMWAMALFFVLIFLLEWFFRKEYFFIFMLFYLINRNELHIHLATCGILAVYFTRIVYLWWLSVDIISQTKKIWKIVSQLQFLAWLVSSVLSLYLLDFIQVNYLFNREGLSRFHFLILVILIYHILSHTLLSIWGHFYFRHKPDSSFLPTYFSTAKWILKFKMSHYLRNLLSKQIENVKGRYQKQQNEMNDLRSSGTEVKIPVEGIFLQEVDYLNEAQSRLTRI